MKTTTSPIRHPALDRLWFGAASARITPVNPPIDARIKPRINMNMNTNPNLKPRSVWRDDSARASHLAEGLLGTAFLLFNLVLVLQLIGHPDWLIGALIGAAGLGCVFWLGALYGHLSARWAQAAPQSHRPAPGGVPG